MAGMGGIRTVEAENGGDRRGSQIPASRRRGDHTERAAALRARVDVRAPLVVCVQALALAACAARSPAPPSRASTGLGEAGRIAPPPAPPPCAGLHPGAAQFLTFLDGRAPTDGGADLGRPT